MPGIDDATYSYVYRLHRIVGKINPNGGEKIPKILGSLLYGHQTTC
jgi:hypothetical protein